MRKLDYRKTKTPKRIYDIFSLFFNGIEQIHLHEIFTYPLF